MQIIKLYSPSSIYVMLSSYQLSSPNQQTPTFHKKCLAMLLWVGPSQHMRPLLLNNTKRHRAQPGFRHLTWSLSSSEVVAQAKLQHAAEPVSTWASEVAPWDCAKIRRPAGVSAMIGSCSCFCSWLVLVPLFSCCAFLLRLNQVHPPLPLLLLLLLLLLTATTTTTPPHPPPPTLTPAPTPTPTPTPLLLPPFLPKY